LSRDSALLYFVVMCSYCSYQSLTLCFDIRVDLRLFHLLDLTSVMRLELELVV